MTSEEPAESGFIYKDVTCKMCFRVFKTSGEVLPEIARGRHVKGMLPSACVNNGKHVFEESRMGWDGILLRGNGLAGAAEGAAMEAGVAQVRAKMSYAS